MKKTVIISDKAKKYIEQGADSDFPVILSSDVIKEVDKIVSIDDSPSLVLSFIHAGEYEDVFNKFKTFMGFEKFLYSLVIFGTVDELNSYKFDKLHHISEFRTLSINSSEFDFIILKSFANMEELQNHRNIQHDYLSKLVDTRQDQEDLINIGKALSSEKDQDKLLSLILYLSKKITGADAGSIYLVELDENGEKNLRFKTSHTFSREIPLKEFVMVMNKNSIAGYVAVTGDVLNIPDVYNLSDYGDFLFSHNSSFDKNHSYITRSMLVVPMRNHHDEIIGVIQLINSKEDLLRPNGNEAFTLKLESAEDFDKYVVTFDAKYDSLLEAIAGQAAVAIENNRLIKQIEQQFEEFVKASVTAIESRDPATSGHSFRVAEICVAMANAVNGVKEGYLKDFVFSKIEIRELEFAALLHDFGKVYIDLSIFMKAKKLYPKDLENLLIRLDYLYRYVELSYISKENSVFQEGMDPEKIAGEYDRLNSEKEGNLKKIKEIKERITSLNEPTIMEEDPEAVLKNLTSQIEKMDCISIDGEKLTIITDNDKQNLVIKRGSLNPIERKEIESHVVHTYNFVSKIPWPPEYRNIPEIALRHHETLIGTGYPDGLKGKESTTLQSRIMAIADIYDALSASDRPYKKAVPLDRVLKIIEEEADRGVLDKDLVTLFLDFKVYEIMAR